MTQDKYNAMQKSSAQRLTDCQSHVNIGFPINGHGQHFITTFSFFRARRLQVYKVCLPQEANREL